jgi:RNA polymerase sigma-70 factor (ECF subfamily)
MTATETLKLVDAKGPDVASDNDVDRSLIARIGKGDRDALAVLSERHQAKLFYYLLRLLGDHGTAEEVLQDTLVAVWKGASRFEARSTVQTWLVAIARRQAHNVSRRRLPVQTDPAELDRAPALSASAEEVALESVDREELAKAIQRLNPVHSEALTLAFAYGLSYQEIAQVVGIPQGTVKSRLSNAKRALRALLNAEK